MGRLEAGKFMGWPECHGMTGSWNVHWMAGLIFMGRLEAGKFMGWPECHGMTGGWKVHVMARLIFMGRLEAGKFMGWPECHGMTGKFMGCWGCSWDDCCLKSHGMDEDAMMYI